MILLQSLPMPPTMNHRFVPAWGRRGLTLAPDHRAFKHVLAAFLHGNFMRVDASSLVGLELVCEIDYVGPRLAWYTKDGKIRKVDVDNRHKALFDGIFPFLELEDSQVFKVEINKVVADVKDVSATVRIKRREV